MKIGQNITLKPLTTAILCVILLVSCGGNRNHNRQFGIISHKIEYDECDVYDIVNDYYYSNAIGNVPSPSSLRFFLWSDRGYLLQLVHQERDWHVLRYIVRNENFDFRPDCRSKFKVLGKTDTLVEGRGIVTTIDGGDQEYNFHRVDQTKFCRITPFWRKDNPRDGIAGLVTTGSINSCIDPESRRTTFDVEYDE